MSIGGYKQHGPDRSAAQRYREAAFARIGRVRGAVIIGAGALTAAIAGVVSAVAPGRTLGAKGHTAGHAIALKETAPRTRALVMPPLENAGQLGLHGPASPPQGTQPQGAQPQATQPQGTQPQGTQPQGTQPQGTQPQPQSQTQAPAPAQQSAPAPVVSGGS